ncbi:unnamed protein product [Arabis nemorensis]|uniref:Uncharacterized protein n=1 Tax=Arabis nemorensis TaxID=586526 RepID=A0A565CET3_9BRAS|nr:unnamed protein product [Arabis nemorensis]
MEDGFEKISSMFGGYETRLKAMELFVNSQGWNDRNDFGVDEYRPRSRFWNDGDCSGGGSGQKNPLEKDLKTGLEKDPYEKDPYEKDPFEKDPSDKDPESRVEKETQAKAEVKKEAEKFVESGGIRRERQKLRRGKGVKWRRSQRQKLRRGRGVKWRKSQRQKLRRGRGVNSTKDSLHGPEVTKEEEDELKN